MWIMDPEFLTFFLIGVPRETRGKNKTYILRKKKKAEYFQQLKK